MDWTDCSTPGSLVSLDDVDVDPPFASGITSLVSLRGTQNEEITWPGTQVISIFYLGIRLETLEATLCDPDDPEPCPYTGAGPDVFRIPMFDGPPAHNALTMTLSAVNGFHHVRWLGFSL